ncbi:LysR family transcriptional regulator [Oxalobacteraceae bacterium]|nr:LysR family transcriptional regulator [Oxalobacteraceae bacterium]
MVHPDSDWFRQPRLKTRQLLLLIAIDEERNIHRAADLLSMTQPAVSKQLKELEDLLGVTLFARQSRGVTPTLYGETMIRHARMALTNLSDAHQEITALKAGQVGQVNVGSIMTPSITLLPAAIEKARLHAPMLRVGIEVESSKLLLDKLQRGGLDFMIGRLLQQSNQSTPLDYEELAVEPICVVARAGHPLCKEKQLSLEQIAQYGWVLSPPGTILRHKFDMMFHRIGLEPPASVIDTTETLLITKLLQGSDFLHAFPRELAHYYEQMNVFSILPIDLPCRMDAFGIITRRDHLLSPGAITLLQAIRSSAAELYPH